MKYFRSKTNKMDRIFLGILTLILSIYIAVLIGNRFRDTDFPVFYSAARVINEKNISNTEIYDIDLISKFTIPEETTSVAYIYSMAAAYILSPLGLMPYWAAKATMIFLNIILYSLSIYIVLKLEGAQGRYLAWTMGLLFLWPPNIDNLCFGQINGILLFLITLAALAATKNHPYWSGIMLGIASLFKIFPLVVAMVFGLKNWRIILACLAVLVLSFIVPGSFEWIPAIQNIYVGAYSQMYLYLKQFSIIWFVMYSAIIAGITAFTVFCTKTCDYIVYTVLAIPAIFLAIPMVEYYHFTLLGFTYAYLVINAKKLPRTVVIASVSNILTIMLSRSVRVTFPQLISLLLLWGTLVLWLWNNKRNDIAQKFPL